MFFVSFLATASNSPAKQSNENSSETVRLKIIGMSDLHGNFLHYDHLLRRPATGGLPYVYSYVQEERKDPTQHVIVMNGGDYMQGQMAAYFYNYIDTREIHAFSLFE